MNWYLYDGAASSDALATATSQLSIINSNFRKYNPGADWLIDPIQLDSTTPVVVDGSTCYYGFPEPPAYLLTSNSTYSATTSWSLAWFSSQRLLDFILKEGHLWGKL